ncbi:MAG TPA: phytanoyl-CoA dioxygenase family protein [Chthonomonadaceae bacterium]|nr:phytanoyl-CoA dioxygenase family protein [Chthonomonadaceae bacterium]
MTTPTLSVPDLSSEYPITAAQQAEYRQNGHILLRGVCTPDEVAAYREVCRETIRKHFPNPKPLAERSVFGQAFLSLSNTWFHDPITRPFLFSRRFAKIAADLMGVDAVRIYHNQIFFKEPGGGPTPWHQDHYYWPVDTPHMGTLWMPLVDITPEMGALRLATGSHNFPFLDEQGITENAMAYFDRIIAEKGLPVVTHEMKAGDATFHAGWTLHSAAANASDRAREVSAVSYHPDGTYLMQELTETRRRDAAACIPGVGPGGRAVSYMSPLVYDRRKAG